mgnify:CR=1 FL=1
MLKKFSSCFEFLKTIPLIPYLLAVSTLRSKKELQSEVIQKTGIKIVKGIELSAKVPKGRMHILGYNIDENNETLCKKMTTLKKWFNSRLLGWAKTGKPPLFKIKSRHSS